MSVQRDPEKTESKTLHIFGDFADKRILEIGCGDGRLTWKYATPASRILGLDPEAGDLRVALIERPSDLGETTSFVRADAIQLPLIKDSFDIVLLAWSL